jgi:hypothetical protein
LRLISTLSDVLGAKQDVNWDTLRREPVDDILNLTHLARNQVSGLRPHLNLNGDTLPQATTDRDTHQDRTRRSETATDK